MMMHHQKEINEQMAESQKDFLKMIGDSFKSMMSSLLMMVMSIVQKVQTMNPTPLSCMDPQLMLTMGNPQTSLVCDHRIESKDLESKDLKSSERIETKIGILKLFL